MQCVTRTADHSASALRTVGCSRAGLSFWAKYPGGELRRSEGAAPPAGATPQPARQGHPRTAAVTSTSTLNSGRVKPETMTSVEAGRRATPVSQRSRDAM